MAELTIKVCGRAGSGKSLLAEFIRRQLIAGGFDDVQVLDDEIAGMVDFRYNQRLDAVALQTKVVIETVQLNRPGMFQPTYQNTIVDDGSDTYERQVDQDPD